MFRKNINPVEESITPAGKAIEPKFLKPKILLMDLDPDLEEAVRRAGFNAAIGTFGKPYKTTMSGGFEPVIGSPSFPNYTEQEIIVVDLKKTTVSGPQGSKHMPDNELDWWVKCNYPIIDPRPRFMRAASKVFNRTLNTGGVFVVFADAPQAQQFILARRSSGGLYDERSIDADTWSFVGVLSELTILGESGVEMTSIGESPLSKLLGSHLPDSHFSCVMQGTNWQSLAENKFGGDVARIWCGKNKGVVIVVPQLARKEVFLVQLLTDVLPSITPHLFPQVEGGLWVHRPEYELPEVLAILQKKTDAEERSRKELCLLSEAIDKRRAEQHWQYDLLAAHDTLLVEAAKAALALFGFKQVIDVDQERDQQGATRREDLQVRDASPLLVVDVKGVSGHPSDAEAFQSQKHATLRMKEWNRTDVQALTIINHQKHLPPLDRDNKMPFRQEILDYATEMGMGLLTTWDLFRLVRGFLSYGWTVEQTQPIFYRQGRIQPVPTHYSVLGRVAQVWKDTFSVLVEENEISTGAKIAFELPDRIVETDIASLQIADTEAECATAGVEVGIKLKAAKPALRKGISVFLVR